MLVPVKEKASKIYIPVDHADGRIRHIITKDDAMKFIKSIPDISKKDISDEKLREQFIADTIGNLDKNTPFSTRLMYNHHTYK